MIADFESIAEHLVEAPSEDNIGEKSSLFATSTGSSRDVMRLGSLFYRTRKVEKLLHNASQKSEDDLL